MKSGLWSPRTILSRIEADLWPDELRLQLVQLAIEGYPRFRVSDFEFHLPRPSYTIHTLNRPKQEYPEREFQLIIGSDNWMVFDRWFESERIVSENKILVYPRPGFSVDKSQLPPNVHVADSPIFEISSTFIREALATGKDIRYFLHPAVYKRIIQQTDSIDSSHSCHTRELFISETMQCNYHNLGRCTDTDILI